MSRATPTKKKTSSSSPAFAFTSVAAQLLLRRGGREAANGDSLEFFSDLRKCQPEARVPGQTERGGPGRAITTRRRGSSAGSDELLSSEIGKHDYDWLLTPPATPPRRSPATSSSGPQVSTTAPNQLAGAGSVSNAKSNSRLGRTAGPEKEKATSRLARSSSVNTPAFCDRTLSSASVSSITTAGSSTSSPRTPGKARSTARPCRLDKAASGKQATVSAAARQPWALSSSKSSSRQLPAPTCSRGRAHATSSAASSPRSTTSTCQPPTPSKRADIAARSRLAGTTSQPRRDVPLTRAARALMQSSSSCDAVSTRETVGKKTTTTQQRWRHSMAAARSEASVDNNDGSPSNSLGRKITADKAPAQRTSTTASFLGSTSGLARTVSRPKSANSNKPTNAGSGGAAHCPKPWSNRLVMSSTSGRIGLLTRTTSEASSAGSIVSSRGRRVADVPAAAAAAAARMVVSRPDAFPSTRYDAMLLREDPRNLTWLRGCDEGDEGSGGGLELLDASLEPFDVATGR